MIQLTESPLDYNLMKYLKRIYSYARYEKDYQTLRIIVPILNSQLGDINQTKSEMGTIIKLLRLYPRSLPKKQILEQIDHIKYRLANYPMFDHWRLEKLNDMLGTQNWLQIPIILGELKGILSRYVDNNLERILRQYNLLPIPGRYRDPSLDERINRLNYRNLHSNEKIPYQLGDTEEPIKDYIE